MSIISQIETLCLNISSEKVKIRQSAFDGFNSLFVNRSSELKRTIGRQSDFKWETILCSIHDSIKLHVARLEKNCSSTELNRNNDFIRTLRQCVNLANEDRLNLSSEVILKVSFECFNHSFMSKYFDICYLEIVRQNVLNSNGNLSRITISDWSCELINSSEQILWPAKILIHLFFDFISSGLLSHCFQLYETSSMSKMILFECILLILQHGCKYKHLADDLHQYVPVVIDMTKRDHQIKAQKLLLMLIHEFLVIVSPFYSIECLRLMSWIQLIF